MRKKLQIKWKGFTASGKEVLSTKGSIDDYLLPKKSISTNEKKDIFFDEDKIKKSKKYECSVSDIKPIIPPKEKTERSRYRNNKLIKSSFYLQNENI